MMFLLLLICKPIPQIELISRLHHCHVVHLLGFCSENQGKHTERLLIFEYMPKGNLRECLNEATSEFFDWGTRVSIALGAAKGLEYLHEAAAPRIMHRDIKSTNVLLDEDWRAKVRRHETILENNSIPIYNMYVANEGTSKEHGVDIS